MSGAEQAEKQRRPLVSVVEAAEPIARTAAAPLMVGHAFDPAEHEADRVADQVIARLRGGVEGDGAEGHEHGSAASAGVQRSATTDSAPIIGVEGGALPGELTSRIEGKRGGGAKLEAGVRGRMESAFGSDLGDVRVHADAESAALSRSISARAFTTGQDIFFGAGEFRPETPDGERTLAHELAHTQQQGGVRRIHRKWDLKAKNLGLNAAVGIRTVKSRPVWFVEDGAGDEIVIKSENQPFGLADIVGSMQKKVNKIKSVDQRLLTKGERLAVDNLIEIHGNMQPHPSWEPRGDYMKAEPKSTVPPTADSREVAVDDALAKVNDPARNVVALSLAAGEGGDAITERSSGPDGAEFKSEIRAKLEDLKHVYQLGEMTTVDLLLGNQDRVKAGNTGNWFYDPAGAVTLIDHIDQGTSMAKNYTPGKFDQWEADAGEFLKASNYQMTANWCIDSFIDVMIKAGDTGAKEWFKAAGPSGKSRREEFAAALIEGMKAARARLLKIFATTRKNIFSRKEHAAKKSIRSAANKASALDAQDQTGALEGGQPDYWDVLKQRAAWLRAH